MNLRQGKAVPLDKFMYAQQLKQPFDHSINLPAGTTARLSICFSSPYGPAILHGHSQLLLITLKLP